MTRLELELLREEDRIMIQNIKKSLPEIDAMIQLYRKSILAYDILLRKTETDD